MLKRDERPRLGDLFFAFVRAKPEASRDPLGAGPENRESAFALVAVIWAIGILSLLFVGYISSARHRTIEATSRLHRVRAETFAEAGIAMAIFDLLAHAQAGRPHGRRFRSDAASTVCRLSGAKLAVTVRDEGGKVDLNTAMPELVDSVLTSLRNGDENARLATRSILSLREPGQQDARQVSARSTTRSLASVYELDQLPGIDRTLFQALLPIATVHSRLVGVDPASASDRLGALLTASNAHRNNPRARPQIPTLFQVESPGTILTISAAVEMPSGVRRAKEAIVEFTFEPPFGYRIREWREDPLIDVYVSRSESEPLC